MKAHPLLVAYLARCSPGWSQVKDAWGAWYDAGCPVVEEEPTFSGLMQQLDQAETKGRLRAELAAANARIRELEADPRLRGIWMPAESVGAIRNAALEEAAQVALRDDAFIAEAIRRMKKG